jgi:hypothetical protein
MVPWFHFETVVYALAVAGPFQPRTNGYQNAAQHDPAP